MQLAAAALGTSLYKKEAQNDHSIVEAWSEDLAQMLGDEKTKMETMAAGLEVPCANFD